MVDLRAERCKTCFHTCVCGRDMNNVGKMFVAPSPMFFSKEYRDEAWRKYKEREAAGFPCEFYKKATDVIERNAMTCYGYRIEQLAFIASVMEKKGITPEQALDMMTNLSSMRDFVYEEQMQIIQQSIEHMLKGDKP